MKISFFTYLQYAWGNRKSIASHEGYVDYTRRCAARPAAAYWTQNSARAGAFPGSDSGWRYVFERLPVHDRLLQEYGLNEIAGQGNAFDRSLRLMDWLTAHSCYNGMEIRACYRFQGKKEDSLRILRYAYGGGFRRAVNCRHKAYVFADCLIAAGIHAIPIGMESRTWRPDEDTVTPTPCHFVVHVWLPEEQRWVMFDPSFNSYITDKAGRTLDLIEIHELHRQGEAMNAARYDFNGTQDCRASYLNGFILGSLLEIQAWDGSDRKGGLRNYLLPENVPKTNKDTRAITTTELLAEPIM
ncbi:MAG: transglutaminase-like domain-containing protein [Oscillospiraceae bacterium]|nr:transglutaminase-like domain-containing protein [Oscillospiraceae bacterium]